MNNILSSEKEILDLVHSIPNGRMFAMIFVRKAAKCEHCNKSNAAWNDLDKCPVCGAELSKERYSRVQLGVKNPKNCTKPGHGQFIGESGEEALKDGRLKYFDMDVVNKDGSRGSYRQCVIANIKEIRLNGNTYYVSLNKEE